MRLPSHDPTGKHPQPDAAAPTAPRRKPVQRRSTETFERIEAAATRLLARGMALESITTPEIAREAGVSIGGLYRFFPDKQAIVDAIAVRRVQDFERTLVAALRKRPPFKSGARLISFILDHFITYIEAHPDFRTILYGGSYLSQSVRQRHFSYESDVAALARRYVSDVLGLRNSPELALRWRMVGEITTPLLGFAMQQQTPAERTRVLAETKRLIGAYLFGDARPATQRRCS